MLKDTYNTCPTCRRSCSGVNTKGECSWILGIQCLTGRVSQAGVVSGFELAGVPGRDAARVGLGENKGHVEGGLSCVTPATEIRCCVTNKNQVKMMVR